MYNDPQASNEGNDTAANVQSVTSSSDLSKLDMDENYNLLILQLLSIHNLSICWFDQC